MKKCALVVGHIAESGGATNARHNVNEFNFNLMLAHKIMGRVNGVEMILIMRESYRTLPDDINEKKPDFIISLHCNAFNRMASGSEVLYYHSSTKSKKLAGMLLTQIVHSMGLSSRGIKPKHSEDRGGYLLRYTNAPCVIAEPFFIDNDIDYKRAMGNIDALADAYVKTIIEYSKDK